MPATKNGGRLRQMRQAHAWRLELMKAARRRRMSLEDIRAGNGTITKLVDAVNKKRRNKVSVDAVKQWLRSAPDALVEAYYEGSAPPVEEQYKKSITKGKRTRTRNKKTGGSNGTGFKLELGTELKAIHEDMTRIRLRTMEEFEQLESRFENLAERIGKLEEIVADCFTVVNRAKASNTK